MKIANLLLAALFVLFAYFQYNDPDPWLWITIYLIVAGICGAAAFGKYNRWLSLAVLGGLIVYLLILLPDFVRWIGEGMPTITGSMKAESPHIELVREFLGLVILIAALGWNVRQLRRKS